MRDDEGVKKARVNKFYNIITHFVGALEKLKVLASILLSYQHLISVLRRSKKIVTKMLNPAAAAAVHAAAARHSVRKI